MSKKRTSYSSAFKTKLVLELLQNADTLAEIASKHNILPQNLVNWKKAFLANAEIAMEPSKAVKEYKKYTYKLRGLNISHANHVWSTDITYIKIAGGMVYMAAIIDWHSKAVLSHRISNTMDVQLVMSVLNDALAKYPHPEIFNTDQGSQYTSEIHTQRLKNLGITISMDGRGRATDNICIERFWRSAKVERFTTPKPLTTF